MMNVELAKRREKDAYERGANEEQQVRRKAAQIKAANLAAQAANGVDVSFGSPLDTLVDVAVAGELDALTVRANTEREAYDERVNQASGTAQANLQRLEGRNARKAGYLDAFGTVLSGASKAYSQFSTSYA